MLPRELNPVCQGSGDHLLIVQGRRGHWEYYFTVGFLGVVRRSLHRAMLCDQAHIASVLYPISTLYRSLIVLLYLSQSELVSICSASEDRRLHIA